ncbi:MAG: glucuronate isomerase [Kiritimatiellaeota bacterium]|nr:glucuronate isomerase [Kiritimatiellota bacterium]
MSVPKSMHAVVAQVFARTPVTDIHTHLFDPAMGSLLLWGIDELLTYHYLVAEVLRARSDITYKAFWAMPKSAQADLIWQELFVKRTPVSEACRGVLTVLKALGLNANAERLSDIRAYFAAQTVRGYVEKVFKLAGVERVYMTNDPLHPAERAVWEKGFERDPRFLAALRLDSALKDWPQSVGNLKALGYAVDSSLSGRSLSEVRRYLTDWSQKIEARYMAISLAPDFAYPDTTSSLTNLMVKAVIPVARARGIPVALMIGVRKAVNPALGDAGDSVGPSDLATVENLARDFGDVTFLVTLLARENMHGLCVAARKFKNIVPFGCWWFLNNPSLIREITAMRLEMLGLSFIPQHSDCRILDQLIYKWTHSRVIIGDVLASKYEDLVQVGRPVSEADIRRDLAALFDGRLINQRLSVVTAY